MSAAADQYVWITRPHIRAAEGAGRGRRWITRRAIMITVGVLLVASCSSPQDSQQYPPRTTRIQGRPEAGFHWPYYIYIGDEAARRARAGQPIHLLVFPNNTGTDEDDFAVHEKSVANQLVWNRPVADKLGTALLVPVFPRPESDWKVYTHALDRDTLTTEISELSRLDLQLIAMIDDAVARWDAEGVNVEQRVAMMGFSASGMFTNRFAVLHPDRVAAAAVGSPGGWPIAPVGEWEGRPLRYPIGVGDLAHLVGEEFDAATYVTIPHFFFIGGQDDNDSVPYDDGYEDVDEALIFELFGSTPVERWPAAEAVYRSVGARAHFRLYPDLGHKLPNHVTDDAISFIKEALAERPDLADDD